MTSVMFSPSEGAPPARTGDIRVLTADRFPVVRNGVKALVNVQPDMRVIGEAGDGVEAVRLAQELNPDVVVVEMPLPLLDGAQVAARVREARTARGVVALTACEDEAVMRLLLGAGARGYVLKRSESHQLVPAIRTVVAGGTYVDPGMGRSNDEQAQIQELIVKISERDSEILRRIALGYSNKQIAARLEMSVKTVETCKSRGMKALGVRDRVELVRLAARCGWLSDDAL